MFFIIPFPTNKHLFLLFKHLDVRFILEEVFLFNFMILLIVSGLRHLFFKSNISIANTFQENVVFVDDCYCFLQSKEWHSCCETNLRFIDQNLTTRQKASGSLSKNVRGQGYHNIIR